MVVVAKITERSKEVATEIMHWTGKRQIEVIERALLMYRRQCRMQSLVDAFGGLKGEAKKSYRKESEELEGAVDDVLRGDVRADPSN